MGYEATDKLILKVGVNAAPLPKPVNYAAGFQIGMEYQLTDSMSLELVHGRTSSTKITFENKTLTNETMKKTSTSFGLNVSS